MPQRPDSFANTNLPTYLSCQQALHHPHHRLLGICSAAPECTLSSVVKGLLVIVVLCLGNIESYMMMATDLLLTVHTDGDFIVPLYWEVMLLAPCPTQSDYPVTELTSSCCIMLMPSARLGNDKHKFDKSLV